MNFFGSADNVQDIKEMTEKIFDFVSEMFLDQNPHLCLQSLNHAVFLILNCYSRSAEHREEMVEIFCQILELIHERTIE